MPEGVWQTAAEQRGVALAAVLTSHDLAVADQRRIVDAINKEWQELASYGLGAALPSPAKGLSELLARYAMPKQAAAALGPLTPDGELMAPTPTVTSRTEPHLLRIANLSPADLELQTAITRLGGTGSNPTGAGSSRSASRP
jgi:hypothetical protein